ncbi:MAG: MmcQ/YjbR family DNA-binding protein [Clostridia bacterium]|nr:MmcQ/YjbR family DNA-binding protein [Clostridia bacterium]
MKKQELFDLCRELYGTVPDYPFEKDFDTAVLRHGDTRKWYAVVMRVPRCKFGQGVDEIVDVVNLKIPTEMFGAFGAAEGVYPAYHMNKLHWVSVLLPDAPDSVVQFLVNASFESTRAAKKQNKVADL